MLVVEAIQINPKALRGPTPIGVANLREASCEGEWLQILSQALHGIQQVFIVIDADILGLATEHSRIRAMKWIEQTVRQLNNTKVKILISARNIDENYVTSQWDTDCWSLLQTDSTSNKRRMQQTTNRRPRKLRRRNRR